MVNYEQVTNIIGDSFMQLAQQRSIATLGESLVKGKTKKLQSKFLTDNAELYESKFGKSLKEALESGTVDRVFTSEYLKKLAKTQQNYTKFAQNASKVYMVAIQTAPMYDTFKEAGFNSTITALGILGVTAGFAKLYSTELGEIAFSKMVAGKDETLLKNSFKEFSKDITGIVESNTDKSLKGFSKVINKIGETFKKHTVDKLVNDPESYLGIMASEGVEEFSEELIQDAVLQTADVLNWAGRQLGFKNTEASKYNYLDTNPMSRYGMSFFGGFIGGAVFKGGNDLQILLKEGSINKLHKSFPKNYADNLVNQIATKGGDFIIEELDKQIKKGNIASTTLSMETTVNNGTINFIPTTDREQTQNNVIGNHIKNYVRSIEAVIQNEGYAITKDQLIDKAVLKKAAIQGLTETKVHLQIANDFKTNLAEFVRNKLEYEATNDDFTKKAILEKLNLSKKNVDALINGERSAEYSEMLAFYLNRSISNGFTFSDIYAYALYLNKPYASLSEEEKTQLNTE